MLVIEWTSKEGWGDPRIIPYQELRLDPAVCALQYASSCFEGMKAYKDRDGGLRLFRPEKNMARLNSSSARLALPTFDSNAVIALISELCNLESRFVPSERGYSLYLRPTIIGTESGLGVGPPSSALLYVIASPSGPFWATGFKAIQLEATDSVRAWPGGVGDKKVGANYAPCVLPQREAALNGSQQNLWLFGEEEFLTEVGSMNLFMAMKDKDSGRKQLITAPLDGTILEGVTRDSVLTLARERLKNWDVIERKLTMGELAEAADEGRLLEVFGSGTAVIISPVRSIFWKRTQRFIPCGLPEDEESGPVAKEMFDWILSIQHGDEEHPWR
ncbi:Branched-chain amino acid aminotransferase [Lasiodiplodia theobromae]|nr:Branched-chain amino acid aminotransferase [Lasiodiplodia theobromae]